MIVTIADFEGWDSLNDVAYEEVLGKIGWVIIHEFGHSIDSNTVYKLLDGTPGEFMTETQWNHLSENYTKIVEFFDGLETENGNKINGYSCENEIIADLIALQCCMEIAKEREDFDYDLFFKSFASDNACVIRPETESVLVRADNHLIAKIRTNYILGMFDKFYDTYDVRKDSKFYIEKENRLMGIE